MAFAASVVRQSNKVPPSSRQWLARQFRDPVVKQRLSHPHNYRSRSAFKLLELDHTYHIFKHDVRVVVDLGAAPGGWSQVVSGKLGWSARDVVSVRKHRTKSERARQDEFAQGFGLDDKARVETFGSWSTPEDEVMIRDDQDPLEYLNGGAEPKPANGRGVIVAVDLLPIHPIPGVKTLQTDFLSPEADDYIEALLTTSNIPSASDGSGNVDVIMSDMAANFTGNRIADIESNLHLCEAVLQFTKRHLRTARDIGRTRGGVLILKHFAHPLLTKFRREELEPRFQAVLYDKPKASRDESSEGYWVCFGWKGNRDTAL